MATQDQKSWDPIATPALLLAALLFLVPIADWLREAWPLRVTTFAWRYAAVQTLSTYLMTPATGALLAVGVLWAGNRGLALRIVRWLLWVVVLILVLGTGAYPFDALQMMPRVPANMLYTFKAGAGSAVLRLVLAIAVFSTIAVAAGRLARQIPAAKRSTDEEAQAKLVVTKN
jgi:hypothetical protein